MWTKWDLKYFLSLLLLFLVVLGLCCCTWAFSSCGKQALLFFVGSSFSMWGLLLLQSTGFRRSGFSRCNMQASVCSVQVLEHGLSSCCAQAELLHKGSWLFYRDRNDKKGSNKEFADGLVVRIQSFHCCVWIRSQSGNWYPSVSAVRQKRRRNQTNSFA